MEREETVKIAKGPVIWARSDSETWPPESADIHCETSADSATGLGAWNALDRIFFELNSAVCRYPDETWPKDVIHMTAIMAEESGEAVQAANDVVYQGKSLEPLRRELAQTAAMCIRCLINLEGRE